MANRWRCEYILTKHRETFFFVLFFSKRVTLRLRSLALHNLRRKDGRWKTRNSCVDNCGSRPSPSSSVSASFLPPSAANWAAILCHSKSHFCPSRLCRLHWQSEGGEEGSHGGGRRGRGQGKEPTEAFFSARCTYLFIYFGVSSWNLRADREKPVEPQRSAGGGGGARR